MNGNQEPLSGLSPIVINANGMTSHLGILSSTEAMCNCPITVFQHPESLASLLFPVLMSRQPAVVEKLIEYDL